MRFNLKKTLAFVAAGLMLPLFALAQSVRVSGTVTDQSGAPVPGAAVMVVDSSNGAVTGVDGTYSLQAGSSAILEVSCMGYTTIRVPVQGAAGLTSSSKMMPSSSKPRSSSVTVRPAARM